MFPLAELDLVCNRYKIKSPSRKLVCGFRLPPLALRASVCLEVPNLDLAPDEGRQSPASLWSTNHSQRIDREAYLKFETKNHADIIDVDKTTVK